MTKSKGRSRRPLFPFLRKPLARSAFFIPAALLLIFLVVFPILQTLVLGFLFYPLVTVTFGENDGDTFRGLAEEVGVTARSPNTNFDNGVGAGARFPLNDTAFVWLRFTFAGLPENVTMVSATLQLYSASHETAGSPLTLSLAGAQNTTAGRSWVAPAATWNAYDGVRAWTGGRDGGAGDRGVEFRRVTVLPTDPDGYYPFLIQSDDGLRYLQESVGASVNLQLYGLGADHLREFVLSAGPDGNRPYLELTYRLPDVAFGYQNYRAVLTNPETINADGIRQGTPPFGTLINNLVWIVIHLPFCLLIGLFLAVTLQRVKGAAVIKSMIFVGMVTPMIVGGIVLRFLFESPVGIVPAFFGLLGIDALSQSWLTSSPSTLLFGLIFGSVWLWTGFSLILYSAGLTTIPRDYFEAAKIDGASPWQTFRRITWPQLRPITLVVVTMTVLWELRLFDIVIAATNAQGGLVGAADVLALQMYRYAFVELPSRFNEAAVVASVLTLLTLIAAAGLFRRMLLGSKKSLARTLVETVRTWVHRGFVR